MGLRGYIPSANTGPKNKRTNSFERGHDVSKTPNEHLETGVPLFIGSMMESLTNQGHDSYMKQPDGSLAARISMTELKIIKEWRKLSDKYQRPEAFECAAASWGILYGIAVTQLHEIGGRKALEAFEKRINAVVFGESEAE